MFRTARRIAALALIAGAALPAANASAGQDYVLELGGVKSTPMKVELENVLISSATPKPTSANVYLKLAEVDSQTTAMLLPAVQKVREAAAR